MKDTFFMPLGKPVVIETIDSFQVEGIFGGFVQFGGIPAVYIYFDVDNETRSVLIPINQVITFSSTKPKQIIL